MQFLKSTDFSKAFILGVAITAPILIGIYVNFFEIGLAFALGALLSSPSDVNGSVRHKRNGILLSALIAVLASLMGGYFTFNHWLLIPVLGISMFAISYLAVYGFRASLISFSGLFALVLSFANISNVLEAYERAFFIGLGGLWYLALTLLWHKMNPKVQTEQFLSESLELTGEYLETRAKLIGFTNEDRKILQTRLLELQSDINTNHETLRDILISSRKSSGSSNYERKRLLIFIQLVDIMELAMANPVNYSKMDVLFKEHPQQLKAFEKLVFSMAGHLKMISTVLKNQAKLSENDPLSKALDHLKESMEAYTSEKAENTDEGYLMLYNLYDYQKKQVEKIHKIERILSTKNIQGLQLVKKNVTNRFITAQEYDFKILLENFSLKSPIFKHSLRLAVVVMVGYSIGIYFSLQNSYWILLTIIVIMRPNYGLTKTRTKQRIIGTLIGGFVAGGIVFLTQNVTVYSILAIVSLVLAFSMIQKNYKTSAVFITLSVVFVYALLKPDVFKVIQYRVVDTLIGAVLAALGNIALWPSWEFYGIQGVIAKSVEANKNYLKEITNYYEKKGKAPTSYKVLRKKAFLELANLSTAFQRMTQEPKSKQKQLDKIYEVVVLNHTFLSSLASMSAYIRNHPTTEASTHFKTYAESIQQNLERVTGLLSGKEFEKRESSILPAEAEQFFEQKYQHLTQLSNEQDSFNNIDSEVKDQLQEAHLISEQLKWLFALTQKMEERIATIQFY